MESSIRTKINHPTEQYLTRKLEQEASLEVSQNQHPELSLTEKMHNSLGRVAYGELLHILANRQNLLKTPYVTSYDSSTTPACIPFQFFFFFSI